MCNAKSRSRQQGRAGWGIGREKGIQLEEHIAMRDIKKISGWQTTDGKTYEKEREARTRQAELDLAELIEKRVGYTDHQITTSEFIKENMQELQALINEIMWGATVAEPQMDNNGRHF